MKVPSAEITERVLMEVLLEHQGRALLEDSYLGKTAFRRIRSRFYSSRESSKWDIDVEIAAKRMTTSGQLQEFKIVWGDKAYHFTAYALVLSRDLVYDLENIDE
jgi:hypothetical protein